MAISVVMPALELTQETGKLVAWRKKEGDRVAKGEPLLEVETDKAVVEIESPAEGILAGIKAQVGAVIPVGVTIAWIVMPGETPPVEGAPSASSRHTTSAPTPLPQAAVDASSKPAEAGVKISPKARRLARELGIDIGKLRGSGPGGEILATDIQAAAESKGARTEAAPATTSSGGVDGLSSIARLMAERTTQSWTTVPHFFVVREVEAGALLQAREKFKIAAEKTSAVPPTHTDLLVALVARALAQHPRMNASWTADGIRQNSEINIAVAMAVEDGVVTGVIRNAATTGLSEISLQRRDLAERAKANKLRPADISGATFTISNLGMHGVDAFTAIIVQPQAGILAVGRISDRVVAVDGRPAIRPMMMLTLSCDHRVVDGARAAAFLNELAEAIRDAATILR
ncbi:MAG: dihydrolipoamide acetyltransferase family protein [Candidatus Acidiferrales bacterium]